jgi:hypothetical protein
MKRLLSHRSTASMVIACLALFVAMGGVGYAAVKINGKDIQNRTIGGKKMKKNTLGGTVIKESSLGTVPKAKSADTAGSATNAQNAVNAQNATDAQNAVNAQNATSAENANTVGGQSAETLLAPRAYAYVDSDGTNVSLDPARTVGITGVTRGATGTFCLDMPFAPKSIVATVEFVAGGGDTVVHGSAPISGGTCAGHQALVRTVDAGASAEDGHDVYVQVY